MTPNPWKVSFDRYGNSFQRYGGGHVLEGAPQMVQPVGLADDVRVQRNAHHQRNEQD